MEKMDRCNSIKKFKNFYNLFISSIKNQCKENLEIICLNIFYNNYSLKNACYHLFSLKNHNSRMILIEGIRVKQRRANDSQGWLLVGQ